MNKKEQPEQSAKKTSEKNAKLEKAVNEAIEKQEKKLASKQSKSAAASKKDKEKKTQSEKDAQLDRKIRKAITKKETNAKLKEEEVAAAEKGDHLNIGWKKFVAIVAAGFICASALLTAVILTTSYPQTTYAKEINSLTKVGYSSDYLGVTERKIPQETKNQGLNLDAVGGYPQYDITKGKYSAADKAAVIAEANSLCAVGTQIDVRASAKNTYDAMDSEGNLYLNGEKIAENSVKPYKLYKHVSSVGLYGGDVSDDENGVIKRINVTSRGGGYNITGLYAPAGEVIKIQMSKRDLETTGGLIVYIGQALYNGQANNIWAEKNINRMPVILNAMTINANTSTAVTDEEGNYTFYVGSFLGGPIYVKPGRENTRFSATISGAVNYNHFILGYTTPEEFEMTRKSSAPYFDLMVWDCGVLHSGPRKYSDYFNYEELNDAAVLWDKISLVSTKVRGTSCGIVFLYDPFVAAGAAVAFPGRNSVNCPAGWMSGSLNYKTFITSGAWGNMHEYNHNFQGWGLPGGGEVTNNALNIVEYSLFTKVSSSRALGSTGEGLSGWNRYTSASWSARQISGEVSPEYPLSIYSTLIHSFGQDNFIKSTAAGGTDNYFNKFADLVHYDMSYYSKLIAANFKSEALSMSDNAIAAMKEKEYPTYVPVASVYQTGSSYEYDGAMRYTETVRPYVIKFGEDFKVDLRPYTFEDNYYKSGSIVLPKGLSYKITRVSNPRYGTLTPTATENLYTYSPDTSHMRSDKIFVTLEIYGTDAKTGIEIAPTSTTLILEFEQSKEMNKSVLERSIYKPNEGTDASLTAQAAYESGFAGFTLDYSGDSKNTTQHSNAEIWGPHDESLFGSFAVLEGKIYVTTDGDYSIGLRGRHNTALYVSIDNGVTYELALSQENENIADNVNLSKTKKYENLRTGEWVYFKAVLKIEQKTSYVAVSWGMWQEVQGTIDENGNFVDENGNIVTSTEPILHLAFASAYRKTYDFDNTKFTTDYFYTREYSANYNVVHGEKDSSSVVFSSECSKENPSSNILLNDGKPFIAKDFASAEKPFDIIVDLGETITANRVVLKGVRYNNATYVPKRFVLYAGNTAEELNVICDLWKDKDAADKNNSISFNLQETVTFRYYKLSIISMNNSNKNLPQLSFVEFSLIKNGGKLISPDNEIITYKGNWSAQNYPSSFGHIYVGKNVSAEFEFYGTSFALSSYASKLFGEMEILIDGKVADVVNLGKDLNSLTYAYTSQELKYGKHKVVIRSKDLINLDSVCIW